MDRRAVLKTGAALSAAALVPGIPAAALQMHGDLAIERFIFDLRFAESADAGRLASARGTPVSGVSGNLTSLWYDDLNLRWKERPMTLAGLTAEDALFVLGTLAPDYRMRVVRKTDWGVARTTGAAAAELPLYSWVIAPAGSV